jgi:hypothetical protein
LEALNEPDIDPWAGFSLYIDALLWLFDTVVSGLDSATENLP